ncbi:MAG: toprim domain-containing protein, partial [Nautiliaceae bacterium]
ENTYSLIRKKGKKVVVVEGLFDALSIEQYKNFKNYDILILNSVNNLKKAINEILKYDEVVLCLDNDEAGKKAKETLKEILKKGQKNVYEVIFESKDINEALCKNEKIKLKKILKNPRKRLF